MQEFRPPYAYIPGQTPRHDDRLFDGVKEVVETELAQSPAWTTGLALFDAGFFWEAHEVWEAVWMAAPDGSAEKTMVQAVIQLANCGLKRVMGRMNAAERLDKIAGRLLNDAFVAAGGGAVMGLRPMDVERLIKRVAPENGIIMQNRCENL